MYSQSDLEALGFKIGSRLKGGEFIELVGDVGAGKTTITRAIARGMGITDTINSPTFTISNQYKAPSGLILIHYDFYRLAEAGIIRSELEEAASSDDTVVVVEWADVVEGALPEDRLVIKLRPVSELERKVDLSGSVELIQRVSQ